MSRSDLERLLLLLLLLRLQGGAVNPQVAVNPFLQKQLGPFVVNPLVPILLRDTDLRFRLRIDDRGRGRGVRGPG